MGKSHMSKGEPIKTVNYLSCLIHPIIYYCQILVEVVIGWEWEEYGKTFELGRAPIFEKHVLTPWESKNPKTSTHSNMHSRFPFFLTHSLIHVSSLRHIELHVCIRSRFWVVYFIFPHEWEVVFVIPCDWVVFLIFSW